MNIEYGKLWGWCQPSPSHTKCPLLLFLPVASCICISLIFPAIAWQTAEARFSDNESNHCLHSIDKLWISWSRRLGTTCMLKIFRYTLGLKWSLDDVWYSGTAFRYFFLFIAIIGGGVVGLLCAILLVMFIIYRMRKKDEGSYPLDDSKPLKNYAYAKAPSREFYAWANSLERDSMNYLHTKSNTGIWDNIYNATGLELQKKSYPLNYSHV